MDDDGLQAKFGKMRTSIMDQGFSLQGIDDAMLWRFLRARSMQVPPATKMLSEYLTWRASFMPLGFILESEIQSELAQGKAYLQGLSKKSGCPLLLMIACRHFGNKTNFEEFKRFVVYALEKTVASAPEGVEKYNVCVDLEGAGYRNMDVKSLVSGLQLLQKYFPERLARLYFVNVPSIFASFWRWASPFLDKVTREKIIFLDEIKASHSLIEEFGADVIPKQYGGKAELILIQDACVPNWPPKVS